MRKKVAIIMMIVFILSLGACTKRRNSTDVFEINVAKDKATQYMFRLKNRDLKGLLEISTGLAAEGIATKIEGIPIMDYKISTIIETGDSAYVQIGTCRSDGEKPIADLDEYIIKVTKSGGEYLVSDVKSRNLAEYFSNGDKLNCLVNETGVLENILNLDGIPLNMYTKGQKIALSKKEIPKKEFKTLGCNLKGDLLAFSTTNDRDTYIGLAKVDIGEKSSGKVSNESLKGILDRPSIKKLINVDILEYGVDSFIFTDESDKLLVQYKKGNSLGLKVYKLPDGDLLKFNLDKIFEIEKYSVVYVGSIKSTILIDVQKAKGVNGISQDLLGKYILDLDEETIDKI